MRAKKEKPVGKPANQLNELSNLTIGYTRVSTFKQLDEGLSVEAQAERIRHYCAARDLPEPSIYTDAESGKTLDRQQWNRVMRLIKERRVRTLIVWKLDRMSRSLHDLIELAEALQRAECELHVIAENVSTDSPSGRLFYHILGALAQWTRETIAENTARVLAYKRSRNEYCGGSPPFGFYVDATKHLRPDPDEQKIVRRVLSMWRSGARVIDIYRTLEASGARNRAGTPVTRKQIYRIINGQTKAVGGSHEAENTGERSAAA